MPKNILVVDIGSDAVSLSAAQFFQSGREPVHSESVRFPFCRSENDTFTDFVFAMLRALRCAVVEVEKQKNARPEQIAVFLRSPWAQVESRTIKVKEKESFIFTQKLADQLKDDESAELIRTVEGSYKALDDEPVIIDMRHISIKLDGYNIPDPLNKEAHELEMTFFASISSHALLQTIEDEFARALAEVPINFYAGLFSSYVVASDAHKDESDFMLVDVGGEVTDILFVKNDTNLHALSFPWGTSKIEESIAGALGRGRSEVESLFNLKNRGVLDHALHHRLLRASKESLQGWHKEFSKSFEGLSNLVVVPDKIFLIAYGPYLNEITEILKSEEFLQFTYARKPFTMVSLGSSIIPVHSSFIAKTNF